MPTKKPTLTVKQAKLVKGVAQGKKKRDAARDAGYSGSPETLSVTASEVLKKPNVQEALQAELQRQGIGMEDIVAPVANALKAKVRLTSRVDGETIEIDAPDLEMQLKGHDRAIKILRIDNGATPFSADTINFINVQKTDTEKYGL